MKAPDVCANTPVSFRNILFLTDFSPENHSALTHALTFARHFKANIFPATAAIPVSDRNDGPQSADSAKNAAIRRLSEMVCRTGLNYHPLAATDSVEKAVYLWSAEHNIDLIVMGTHGRRGFQRLQLGSIAETVFRHATCPVLTVGPFIRPKPILAGIRRVLFASDLSKASETAAALAVAIAQEYKAHLTLLHALPAAGSTPAGMMTDSLNARKRLLEFVPSSIAESRDVDFVVKEGDPAECILTEAREKDVDLIVLGLPLEKPFSMCFCNGVTYNVVSSATAPVLTVRTAGVEPAGVQATVGFAVAIPLPPRHG
ncbi:MAG: universal stress protein [Acidobacteriia bacterium]|nr:universal stress protein [Terriglobia bacterium]